MNRKDTIIVAALINAGLLIVLFVSALKSSDGAEKISVQKESAPLISNEVVAAVDSKRMIGDEVDMVLKQYAQKDPLETPALPITAVQPAPSFVDDLQGIIQPVAIPVAAAVATSNKEEVPALIEIKVKKGDMLEKIARQHHTSVSEIMKINHLSSTQLKIGQVLKISSSSPKQPAVAQKAQVALLDSTPSKFYTVKTGDSPWTIAVKNHMKVEELLKLNNISEDKARKLKPGDQIRIR